VWRGLSWYGGYESLQTRMLLALITKSKAARLGGGEISGVHRESAVLAAFPRANAALGLCVFSEDEAESHVQAADGKEEKCGDEREFVDVVGEDRCSDESLENPEWAEAKLRTKDREKAVEEGHRPRDLGQEEKDELEDDEKTVDHCPEGTCRLIGNCAARYVAASPIARTGVML